MNNQTIGSLRARNGDSGFGDTRIRRHKIKEWESYEVKKEELEALEKGTHSNKFLDFGIGSGTAGMSFIIAWLSTNKQTQQDLYIAYLITWIILLIIGITLLIIWCISRNSLLSIFDEIKNRPIEDE